jgi:hypothetical protein
MAETLTRERRQVFEKEPLDLFWKFIYERQKVWHMRVVEGNSPPWTDDEILQKYRFTNVYRHLDPGTQYVIQNILEVDAPCEDKIFNVMLYRLIGRQETHEYLGFQTLVDFDSGNLEKELKHRRDEQDRPVFTGAYMVSGYNHMGSSDKIENVIKIFGEVAENTNFYESLLTVDSMETAYDLIRSQQGFGNFLSYQVLVDLLYPVGYYDGGSVLPYSPDDWSTPGPGAKKGLDALVQSEDMGELEVMRWLRVNQEEEFNRLGLDFPYLTTEQGGVMHLSLADIQNCLCEFYKYHKILHSNGRARRRFRCSEMRSNDELRSIYSPAPVISI